jgi:hypothetical protein
MRPAYANLEQLLTLAFQQASLLASLGDRLKARWRAEGGFDAATGPELHRHVREVEATCGLPSG